MSVPVKTQKLPVSSPHEGGDLSLLFMAHSSEVQEFQPQKESDFSHGLKEAMANVRKRKMRKIVFGFAWTFSFVVIPLFLIWHYLAIQATPLYEAETLFVFSSVDPEDSGGLAAMMFPGVDPTTSLALKYLKSRNAAMILDESHDIVGHFSMGSIDPLQRMPDQRGTENTFRIYERFISSGTVPMKSVAFLRVKAVTPDDSIRFSQALLEDVEEHLNKMGEKARESAAEGAEEGLREITANLNDAMDREVLLQERYRILSSSFETQILTSRIAEIDGILIEERLSLNEIRSTQRPNRSRLSASERRVSSLESERNALLEAMTKSSGSNLSLARMEADLAELRSEIEAWEAMRMEATERAVTLRSEAERQIRYLNVFVPPNASAEPSHPKTIFWMGVSALLILAFHMIVHLVWNVLRDQIE